jgi:hypothetical protein
MSLKESFLSGKEFSTEELNTSQGVVGKEVLRRRKAMNSLSIDFFIDPCCLIAVEGSDFVVHETVMLTFVLLHSAPQCQITPLHEEDKHTGVHGNHPWTL